MLDKEEYILQMATDMEDIAILFNKYSINTPSISRMSSLLKARKSLSYDLKSISIPILDDDKFPKRVSHKNTTGLVLYFDMNVVGDCDKLINKEDPFSVYAFNIYIKGKNKNNHQSKLVYAIHFDRHDGSIANLAHPLYHFQFGGEKLKKEDIDHGQALFLDSPRIMHHPMDFFLGIDFILSNFFPNMWKNMQKEQGYVSILKRYQEYFIMPYFQSVVDHFNTSRTPIWNSYDIYPQLVQR